MYDLCTKSSNKMASPFNRQPTTSKMHRGSSLEHILKEITNFGGLEAETQASINELVSLETRMAKAKSVDALHRFENCKSKFKHLLVNDNMIIVDKNPAKPDNSKTPKPEKHQTGDLPMPNTVSRYKNIFETLSKPAKSVAKTNVGRSISVRVTTSDWKRVGKVDERCRTLPSRLTMPAEVDEVDQARDWLNACSPVSPDVIQKLRERGTSMTFFGRPAYTPSPSPVSDSSDEWKKPRIIGMMRKKRSNEAKAPSSLGSSSTCSDEELHFTASFDLSENEAEHRPAADDDSGHEDYHSYDVVFLDASYQRANKSRLVKKGVWLRDPFWSGSSYIIYDFRESRAVPKVKRM